VFPEQIEQSGAGRHAIVEVACAKNDEIDHGEDDDDASVDQGQ
jgi:hypothetical protein